MIERYGIEQVQRWMQWGHPGEVLPDVVRAAGASKLESNVEAISDTELGESSSNSPMEVEAGQ